MADKPKRVLIIAGSDSGGGAGIQADIKTVTMLGGYAMTAITAITVQNTQGVFGVHEVPLPVIRDQIRCVIDDLGVDAIKTGMLHSAEVIETVTQAITPSVQAGVPLVVDPVMTAKGGAALLQEEAMAALKSTLLPLACVVTPNVPEAELLSGFAIESPEEIQQAAQAIAGFGCAAVLIKGGHLESSMVRDMLFTPEGVESVSSARLETPHTHGTGCTLASALATRLAQGLKLAAALESAHAYVHRAIATAPGLGHGHGPINHAHPLYGSTASLEEILARPVALG